MIYGDKKVIWNTNMTWPVFPSANHMCGCRNSEDLLPNSLPQASGQVILENAPDNFNRGKVDTFNVSLPDLGNLNRVIIGHNEKGNQPRWHLEGVSVRNKTLNTPTAYFPCGTFWALTFLLDTLRNA
jgi:hypothetical protein